MIIDDKIDFSNRKNNGSRGSRCTSSFLVATVATVLLVESLGLISSACLTDRWIFEQVRVEGLQFYEQYYGFFRFCSRRLVAVTHDYFQYKCTGRLDHFLYPGDSRVSTISPVSIQTAYLPIETWELACLGLLVVSIFVSGLVLVSFISCARCWRFYLDFLTPWASVATACSAVAIGLFSNRIHTRTSRPDLLLGRAAPEAVDFGWSYWLVLAGAGLQFLATVTYGVAALLKRNCDI